MIDAIDLYRMSQASHEAEDSIFIDGNISLPLLDKYIEDKLTIAALLGSDDTDIMFDSYSKAIRNEIVDRKDEITKLINSYDFYVDYQPKKDDIGIVPNFYVSWVNAD